MEKLRYDLCNKPEKDMFHGVCTERCLMSMNCFVDGRQCIAYSESKTE